jgi:hypothetical protein
MDGKRARNQRLVDLAPLAIAIVVVVLILLRYG